MAKITSSCAFLSASLLLVSCAQAPAVEIAPLPSWIQQTERQAIENGVTPATAHAALDTFEPNPRVVELDKKQPETTISFAAYRHNTIAASRIQKGAALLQQYAPQLNSIEEQTGVPAQIIVALWGVESSFGQNMGDFDTVNSLATLAYEGRRADFFRGELFSALHILDQERMTVGDLRGSWAGAMGQCQFMPSTYLKYAVDADGDSRRDIWHDPLDVIGSIANYLAAIGWQRDMTWGREVALTQDIDASDTGLEQKHSLAEWSVKGVTALDGSQLPQQALQASLIQPDGADGASFLIYDNLRAIMRWNHSTYFALSVGLLSDEIKQY